MINYFLLNFLILLQSWCSLNQCWEVLSFPKEEPMGKGQVYMLSKNIELCFWPFNNLKELGQRTYPKPQVFSVCSFIKIASSLRIFKTGTILLILKNREGGWEPAPEPEVQWFLNFKIKYLEQVVIKQNQRITQHTPLNTFPRALLVWLQIFR